MKEKGVCGQGYQEVDPHTPKYSLDLSAPCPNMYYNCFE